MNKNNPIQVVFNSSDYIYKPTPTPGGGKTDFYEGRDDQYIEHKKSLLRQIDNIALTLSSANSRVGVVKVELNPDALAKSHRPMKCLFPEQKSPLIGGLGIGQLLFQVTARSLQWLHDKIESSEEHTNWVHDNKKKKLVAKPSIAKSETGAVDKISYFGVDEKTNFSAEDAVRWLAKQEVAKGYIVDLIEFAEASDKGYETSLDEVQSMQNELVRQLHLLGSGVILSKLCKSDTLANAIYVRLIDSQISDTIINFDGVIPDVKLEQHFDFDVERNRLLLKILRNSPLVRSVSLPPAISRSENASFVAQSVRAPLPVRISGHDYPKVGVIDSGVINTDIKAWCFKTSNGFDPNDCDPNHGSQVASLLVGGKSLNPDLDGLEEDGCLIYDIWMPVHNEINRFHSYFDAYGEFFDWLDMEVRAAVKEGVKIFNLSINFNEYIRDDAYSFSASQIDRISKKHNVIFVISAGNLAPLDYRQHWPSGTAWLSDIDRLSQPAEAITAVTVGAINPPGCDKNIHGAPTIYTRRGPGVSMGVKPDVVHYGGFVQRGTSATGLVSINGKGDPIQESGTSFSAPLVAKVLASLDHRTQKSLTRNALVAMLIHHSHFPSPLLEKSVSNVVRRRYAGFGTPSVSENSLVTDDYTITLLFEGTLKKGEVVEFEFKWPNSLFRGGKCYGAATLTLVYDSVTDINFGGEYCRVNLDAALQQSTYSKEKDDWVFRKNCDSIWEDKVGKDASYEKTQIEHGLKWWPIKKYHREIKKGVGKSQDWRLKIDSIERNSGDYPKDGISFCAILTIQDPKKESANLFNEVRQELTTIGVEVKSVFVSQDIIIQSEQ